MAIAVDEDKLKELQADFGGTTAGMIEVLTSPIVWAESFSVLLLVFFLTFSLCLSVSLSRPACPSP